MGKNISKTIILVIFMVLFTSQVSMAGPSSSSYSVTGKWEKEGNWWYYIKKDGSLARNEVTPDGYYVDCNGRWFIRNIDSKYTNIITQTDNNLQRITDAIMSATDGSRIETGVMCESYNDVCSLIQKWRTCYNVSINPTIMWSEHEVLIQLSNEELEIFKQQTTEVNKILNSIAEQVKDKSEPEKVQYISQYISGSLDYDVNAVKESTYDNIVKQRSVCGGYAKLFYILMNKLNVQTELVLGSANNGYHAWNRINIANNWYYYDITYFDSAGSPIYINNTNPNIDGTHIESIIYN